MFYLYYIEISEIASSSIIPRKERETNHFDSFDSRPLDEIHQQFKELTNGKRFSLLFCGCSVKVGDPQPSRNSCLAWRVKKLNIRSQLNFMEASVYTVMPYEVYRPCILNVRH